MREIKFRCWDKANVSVYSSASDSKRMSFYGPEFDMDDDRNCISFFTPKGKQAPFGDYDSQRRYILMQFTGLKDKNGKEIYEGDICSVGFETPLGIVMHKGVMKFNEKLAQFGLDVETELENIPDHVVKKEPPEIIGNIYESPELLNPK